MFNEEERIEAPIAWGMVGGGRGSEIGYAHRSAATRDSLFEFKAGALDLDPQKCRDFGENLKLIPERCYADYHTLFAEEAKREDGIQAVSIATPNSTHYEIVKAALNANLHVVCEKPIAFLTEQAQELHDLAQQKNKLLAVMYGYSGFPMVHQAKTMIAKGALGEVRIVNVQFAHGFHSSEVEAENPKNAWRMNPAICGDSYVLNDIGTHAFYLAELVSGLSLKRLLCSKQSFVSSRAPLEDNAQVMMEFSNGAVGNLWASAVNAGSTHQQKIRVVGEKASIEWWDEYPNQLRFEMQGKPVQILEKGMPYLNFDEDLVGQHRIGAGHPEGFLSSWANLYHRFALVINALDHKDTALARKLWYPNSNAGVHGVRFVNRCLESAHQNSSWVEY